MYFSTRAVFDVTFLITSVFLREVEKEVIRLWVAQNNSSPVLPFGFTPFHTLIYATLIGSYTTEKLKIM